MPISAGVNSPGKNRYPSRWYSSTCAGVSCMSGHSELVATSLSFARVSVIGCRAPAAQPEECGRKQQDRYRKPAPYGCANGRDPRRRWCAACLLPFFYPRGGLARRRIVGEPRECYRHCVVVDFRAAARIGDVQAQFVDARGPLAPVEEADDTSAARRYHGGRARAAVVNDYLALEPCADCHCGRRCARHCEAHVKRLLAREQRIGRRVGCKNLEL